LIPFDKPQEALSTLLAQLPGWNRAPLLVSLGERESEVRIYEVSVALNENTLVQRAGWRG